MSTVLALYRCTATPNLSFGGATFANSWLSFDISQIADLATFKTALADSANAATTRTITQIQLPAMKDDLDIYFPPNDSPVQVPGPPGLSVASCSIVNGRFRFTLSNNSVIDGGVVPVSTTPGPAGRGISNVAINGSNHLIVTMTDGSQIDAGFIAGGAPAAPSWTANPTITDDGTPQVGETLTGNDGTIVGGTVSTRQWLLNGSAISGANGGTYVPTAAGSLVFRVTAVGAGGTTSQDSAIKVVTPAPSPTPSPTPSPVFSTPPYFLPLGGYANVTQFTADNGVALNTNSASTRRWLLDGTNIGTGPTVTPNAAGNLLLEVTAHGDGGDTVYQTDAIAVVVAADPILAITKTTPTGTNPMRWSSKYQNLIPDDPGTGIAGDQIGCDWKIDAGAYTSSAPILFTRDMFLDSVDDGFFSITYPDYLAQLFAGGHLVTVREWVLRAGVKYYSVTNSDGSATISDTPQTAVLIVPINREVFDFGFVDEPQGDTFDVMTVEAHAKIAIHIIIAHNGSGDITTVTGNSGAVTFTRCGSEADGGNHSRGYVYRCEDIGNITTLQLDIQTGGSVNWLLYEAFQVKSSVAGNPHATAFERRTITNEDPHIGLNDGLVAATNGAMVTTIEADSAQPITFTGSTALAAKVFNSGKYIGVRSAVQYAPAGVSIIGQSAGPSYGDLHMVNSEWRSS